MNKIIYNTIKVLLFLVIFWGIYPLSGWCKTGDTDKIKKSVESSISIRQETQENREKWEIKKTKLAVLYKNLKDQHETLALQNKDLLSKKQSLAILNQTLIEQKKQSLKIQKELMPFLLDVYTKIEALVLNNTPFLMQERLLRLSRLKTILNDSEITVASKYRKLMETLSVEAQYGSTIEVYQEKVLIGDEKILGNIFRLGRVSLLFLSLDQEAASFFNVAQNSWQPLEKKYLPAIRSVVEIGKKQRPAELLPLPLGKIAAKEGVK